MKVIDLKIALDNIDDNLVVFFDATPVGAQMFKLVQAEDAQEVTTSENEKICLISSGFEEEKISSN